MARNERVQVSAPQFKAQLRPSARPVDTFVAPQQVARSRLFQVADALGSLNQGLTHLADTMAMQDRRDQTKQKNEGASAQQIQSIAMMPREEMLQKIKNGELPAYADDKATKQVRGAMINKAIDAKLSELSSYLAEHPDPSAVDMNELTSTAMGEFFQQIGDDADLSQLIRTRFGTWYNGARNGQVQQSNENYIADRRQAYSDELNRMGDIHNDQSQEAFDGDSWYEQAESIGKSFNMSNEEMNQEQLNSIAKLATTDPHLATELLNHERGGLGAIGKVRKYGNQVAQINKAIYDTRVKQEREAKIGSALSSHEQEIMDGDISAAEIFDFTYQSDVTGEIETITAKELSGQIKERMDLRLQAEAQEKRMTGAEWHGRRMSVYARNGWEDNQLKNSLDNAANVINNENLNNDGLEIAGRAFDNYRRAREQQPNWALDHVREDDQRFFELAAVAADSGLYEKNQALKAAHRVNLAIKDNGGRSLLTQEQRDRITRESQVAAEGWVSDTSANNSRAIKNKIELLAQQYIMLNVDDKKAVEMASNRVRETSSFINGSLVSPMSGFEGPEFSTVVNHNIKKVIAEQADFYKMKGISAKDVQVSVEGDAVYLTHPLLGYLSVPDAEGRTNFATISRSQLLQTRREFEAEEKIQQHQLNQRAVEDQGSTQRRRAIADELPEDMDDLTPEKLQELGDKVSDEWKKDQQRATDRAESDYLDNLSKKIGPEELKRRMDRRRKENSTLQDIDPTR